MTSKIITLEKLNNTRDLFDMKTKDGGRIKKGKLLRSGHLFGASERDIEKLSEQVNLIVDFRTDAECAEKPDPTVPHAEYLHLPVLQSLTAGITREKASGNAVAELSQDPAGAREYMTRMYLNFVTSYFAVAQYAKFLNLLCEERDGAVLWHCTAGKDRVGFATVMVQEILGVPRDDIFEDYLLTNQCLREEVETLITMIRKRNGGVPLAEGEADEALIYLFSAKEEYLEALYGKIEEMYGSFETFAEKGLKIDQVKRERLRKLYLD